MCIIGASLYSADPVNLRIRRVNGETDLAIKKSMLSDAHM